MGRGGVVKDKDKDKELSKEKTHNKEKQKERMSRRSDKVDLDRAGPSNGRRDSDSEKAMERKHSARPTDELKLLQDSLSQFFTPSAGRRCRQPPRKFDESGMTSDESFHHHNDSGCEKHEAPTEKVQRKKKTSADCSAMKPLTVDVDSKAECPGSCSSARSAALDLSPSRRMCEKLVDSLSPYFSASSEKRRTTQKGEFAQLHTGKAKTG
ncbi:hypothetical protein OESDEN_00959 [Oesophagostomum dentatum]|uniref:Uncharacterized protein n=1 Tax=Oesophagostomum dentatum TaxID=61180 RepID=A0A0B1TSG1_OESDE|nr:hypothetical protein OESDEN_00959 [Oesophagostomum dentatum]